MNLIRRILAAQVAILTLWVVSAQATTTDDAIARRLEPVGKVYVQGRECEDVDAVTAAAGDGGTCSDEDTVGKTCNTCHDTNLLGASKISDKAEQDKRAKEQGGLGGLLAKTISSINTIPPKGTCADCSDGEPKAAIGHMPDL